MRSATGAAMAAMAMGAQAVFGASRASAQDSCCFLVREVTPWCPLLCVEVGHTFRCWSCYGKPCKCCECTLASSCFSLITLCSYSVGCCTGAD